MIPPCHAAPPREVRCITCEQSRLTSRTAYAVGVFIDCSLLGGGCAALVVLGAQRSYEALVSGRRDALILLIVLVIVAIFCCTVGFRLALNLPNRYGSLLSPPVWAGLAGVFVCLGVLVGAMVFVSAANAGGYIMGATSLFAFAALCWKARDLRRS
jgi:hypothetical protein